MEVRTSNATEINRVDFLYRKRKIGPEPVGVPRPKHVRWGQVLEHYPSSDSAMELTRMGGELERKCVGNSITSSLQSNSESTMFPCDKDKTDPGYSKTRVSDETSSSSSGCTADKSIAKPTSNVSDTLTDHQANLLGFGSLPDFGYSDYAEYEELENLLVENILSSNRWSGDQDGGKKLTIDEEFEEYFSMLML